MMPLTMADPGVDQLIKKVGGREDTRKFLENLGFVPGAHVSVVSDINGNLILNIKDSRIAIDQSMARRIFVEEETE